MKYRTKSEIYDAAMKQYGIQSQTMVLCEESGELIQAASKMLRSTDPTDSLKDHLAEEMADVLIMIEQLKRYYGITAGMISNWKYKKLIRLGDHLEETCSSNG